MYNYTRTFYHTYPSGSRKNKIHKLGKSNGRIPILQLTISRSKKQKETEKWAEKDDFKPGSNSEWKRVETFDGDYKLNCDQLVNMNHTQQ